jgi:hypothetical protein
MTPRIPWITLFLTAMAGIACGADPALDAFAQRYVKAATDGDAATLEAMTYMEGASPGDFKTLKHEIELKLKYKNPDPPTEDSVVPLDRDLVGGMEPKIFNGEKTERTLEPVGMIKITTESSNEDLKARIYKADVQGQQKSDVLEQDIAKETPLIHKGKNS